MVSIKWCMQKEGGLELVEPNEAMAKSYIGMAQESIGELKNVKSNIWKATVTYYAFYYSLYALMARVGVKCGIHSCSLEFMGKFLNKLYSKKDIEMINRAFGARIDLQYYANRPVDVKEIDESKAYIPDFLAKTRDIISGISVSEIKDIRGRMIEG